MIKEFEINDILSAVNSISKIDKKNTKIINEKNSADNNVVLAHNDQVKLDKTEILVLDQMIE